MAVMAIFLTVAIETVTFQARREREAELVFRGNQIVEAVRLFRARNGRFPIQLAELANAKPRVLRKVWRDPMTGKPDWLPVFFGQAGGQVPVGASPTPGAGAAPTPSPTPAPGMPGQTGTEARGPIIGVHSRNCADSIRVFNGHTRYCDWNFVLDLTNQGGGTPQPAPSPKP